MELDNGLNVPPLTKDNYPLWSEKAETWLRRKGFGFVADPDHVLEDGDDTDVAFGELCYIVGDTLSYKQHDFLQAEFEKAKANLAAGAADPPPNRDPCQYWKYLKEKIGNLTEARANTKDRNLKSFRCDNLDNLEGNVRSLCSQLAKAGKNRCEKKWYLKAVERSFPSLAAFTVSLRIAADNYTFDQITALVVEEHSDQPRVTAPSMQAYHTRSATPPRQGMLEHYHLPYMCTNRV